MILINHLNILLVFTIRIWTIVIMSNRNLYSPEVMACEVFNDGWFDASNSSLAMVSSPRNHREIGLTTILLKFCYNRNWNILKFIYLTFSIENHSNMYKITFKGIQRFITSKSPQIDVFKWMFHLYCLSMEASKQFICLNVSEISSSVGREISVCYQNFSLK